MTKLSCKEQRLRRHARVRKYINGTSERPRLAVFRSSAEIYAQVIDDVAGHTLASASTIDRCLKREQIKGLSKTEKSRLVGKLVAERAKEKGITQVVFRSRWFSLHRPGQSLGRGSPRGWLSILEKERA